MNSPILMPLVALVLWSFIMWAWLYATRIPAIKKHKISLDPHRPAEEFHAQLPPQVRWKADNYNHLMEQPTLFYAVALTLAFLGAGHGVNAGLAWLYVGLRIAHSLVQALINVILLRFAIFMAASLVLLVMSVRAALLVF
ncbi:MAG: MAPEG family protein [Beijerinckiaceae bacterium]|nr:MAPEG family protein [Beijerinckiaceae bacterium]MCI0735720.1 MAPEG family protein [Beijerinckiaceae bacterium]